MQVTEAHLCYHVTSVNTNAAQRLGNPYRVASEDLVVLRCTSELYATQLHDEVVNELLNLLLGEGAVPEVSLCVYIKEGGSTSKGHSSTVLLLNCAQIAEVYCLDSFLNVCCRVGNIAAVGCSHFLHQLKSCDLLGNLLTKTDNVIGHNAAGGILLSLLVLDQSVDTVQSYTSVVADDTSTSVCIRKTGNDMGSTAGSHLLIVSVEAACVMCLSVNREELGDLRIYFVAVVSASLLCHTDTAIRLKGSLEGLVCLETYDGLLALVKVSGTMGSDSGNNLGVHVKNAACFSLLLLQVKYHCPKILCVLGRISKEGLVTIIRMVVSLDEVTNVDFFVPFATYEICLNWFHFEMPPIKFD